MVRVDDGSPFDTDPTAQLRLFRSVVTSMAEGVVVQDRDGAIVSANRRALEILGLSLDQLRGLTSLDPRWRSVRADGTPFPGDEHPAMQTLASGLAQRDVVMGVHLPDGTLRWISINTEPLLRDDTIEGVVASFHDVTAGRVAEAALRQHAAFGDMLVDCLTRFAVATVGDADAALADALTRAAGCLESDHIVVLQLDAGRETLSVTHEYRAPYVHSITAEYQHVPVALFSSAPLTLQDETVVRRSPEDIADPTERTLHAREGTRGALRIPIRNHSGVQGAIAFHRHVSNAPFDGEDERHARVFGRAVGAFLERIHAERRRHQSESRYHLIADNTEDVIWLYNVHQRCIEYASPSVERLTGYTPAEVQSRPFDQFLDPASTPAFTAAVQSCIRAVQCGETRGRTVTCDVQVLQRNGPPIPVEVVVNVVQDAAGHVTHVQGVGRDVRRRRELEQQLAQAQKLESIGRLAGGVAHDFNNMLTVIMSEADLALADLGGRDMPVTRALNEIAAAARRSAALTRQLLAFARRQSARLAVIDLNEHIRVTLTMLQRLIGDDIALQFTPGPGLAFVKMDPSHIDQILTNLAVNARDAISGAGQITIATRSLTVAPADASLAGLAAGPYCEIAVTDTGAGMLPEVQARIFDPFFTTKEAGTGTGLGLSTVYGIVTQNRGSIAVDSQPGHGTTFRLLLPINAEAVAAAPPAAEPNIPRGSETILIVEDERAILLLASRLLSRQGYRVLTASHPQEAVDLVSREQVDLVLSDVLMPEMNGLALLDLLLTHRPTLKHVFMSGYSADVLAQRGGVTDERRLIQKPFDRAELARAVRDALDEARSPGEPI